MGTKKVAVLAMDLKDKAMSPLSVVFLITFVLKSPLQRERVG